MEVITSIDKMKELSSSVITVGNYDGIHKGHQDVLSFIVNEGKKRNVPSCLITFDPNPFYVISDDFYPVNLQSLEAKLSSLSDIGIDKVLIIPFTKEFSLMTATDFANKILNNYEKELSYFKQVCPIEMLDKLDNPIILKPNIKKVS